MTAKNHIIYLIGFMGSGKSTIGKRLAAHLGWSFIDLDKLIEEHTGRTIPEIFSQKGENYFRETESFLLNNLNLISDTVISTGGGAPCYGNNMEFMCGTGLTLYLKLTPEELKSRLSESKGDRPLIKDLNDKSLMKFIKQKMAEREKWYDKAVLTFTGLNPDFQLILQNVKAMLNISSEQG
jgi:shikimate kinase